MVVSVKEIRSDNTLSHCTWDLVRSNEFSIAEVRSNQFSMAEVKSSVRLPEAFDCLCSNMCVTVV